MSDITIHSHIHHTYVETHDTPEAKLSHSEKIPEHEVPKDSVEEHENNPYSTLVRNPANDPITLVPPDENLLNSNITIGAYAFTTGNATEQGTIQQGRNQYANSNNFSKLSMSIYDRGLSGLALYAAFVAMGTDQTNLLNTENSQIQTQQGNISTFNNAVTSTDPSPGSNIATNDLLNGYNEYKNNNITSAQFDVILSEAPTSDQDAVNKINTASQMYKDGEITLNQFNEALNSYNTYMNSRNAQLAPAVSTYNNSVTTFNGQVEANNATTNTLNQTRAGYGVPPIPAEEENAISAPSPYFPTFSYPATASEAQTFPTATLPSPIPNLLTPISSSYSSTNDLSNGYNEFVNGKISSSQFDAILSEAPNSDQDAVNKVNLAARLYQDGDITLNQFNEALTSYNTYMKNRNNQIASSDPSAPNPFFQTFTYPSASGAANPATAAEAQNFAPVSLPSNIPSTGAPISNTNITESLISNYYIPYENLLTNGNHLSQTQMNTAENADQYRRYNLAGKDPLGSDTYISRQHIVAPNSTTQAGGGVAISNQPGADARKPHHELHISDAINKQTSNINNTNLELPALGTLGRFGVQLSLQTGLISVTPGVLIVGTNVPKTPHHARVAAQVGFSIANVDTANQLVHSGVVHDVVHQAVDSDLRGKDLRDKDNRKLDNDKVIRDTTDRVTTTIHHHILRTATLNAAIGLHAPGLTGQVFANTHGINHDDLRHAANRTPTISQILSEPGHQALLQSLLGDSKIASQAQVNAALGSITFKDIHNEAQLKQALVNAFIAQGLNQDQAEELASLGVTIVNSESSNQALTAGLLDQNANQSNLEQDLVNSGLSTSQASAYAQTALSNVIGNPLITNNQEYQLALQIELQQLGLSAASAQAVAQEYVTGVVSAAPPVSPLLNPTFTGALTRPQLAEAVHTHVYGQLLEPLGPDKAREVANHATATIVGSGSANRHQPPSLIDSLNTQNVAYLNHERTTTGTPAERRLADSYSEYTRPSRDLYNFSRNIIDPGHTLTMFWASGPMYSSTPIPKNFQKPLDVWV